VKDKIQKQAELLARHGHGEFELLEQYASQLVIGDETNREGHAAKVYFNALFGNSFSRSQDIPLNAALNYGYGIILSAFNREIVANGYITQLGLFHENLFNKFNLGSDLMEPFRILVDSYVYNIHDLTEFNHDIKMALVGVLNSTVVMDGKKQYVNNAIKIYCKSVFDALNSNDIAMMRLYSNELQVYESSGIL
jgi:CRISPR-associated endonuclease Cas1 subtype II